jgi:hypothetical protein
VVTEEERGGSGKRKREKGEMDENRIGRVIQLHLKILNPPLDVACN